MGLIQDAAPWRRDGAAPYRRRMTTFADTSLAGNDTAVRESRRGRIGALAGAGFSLALFAGVAMLEIPRGASDTELVRWWSDSGNQHAAVVSMYLFAVAGLLFLVFLAGLRSHLLRAEQGTGQVTSLVVGAGTVFVAMVLVAGAMRGVIAFAVISPANGEPLPGPDTLRYVPQLGYAITGTGGLLAAALCIAGTSWLVATTGAFRRWVAWVGAAAVAVVVGAAALLSAVLAIPALLVWTLAVSAAMWKARA